MVRIVDSIHSIQDKKCVDVIRRFAFWLVIIIEMLIVLIDKSEIINPIEGRLFQITFALCVLKVALTKYDFREYIVIALFSVFGLSVDMASGRNEILRFIIFIAACKDIDMKKCMKLSLWIQVIGCFVIAMLSITGLFGRMIVEKEYQGSGYALRYCFGMGNANSFHTMVFVTILLISYVYGGALKIWGYLLMLGTNIGLFFLTDCKTSTGMASLTLIVYYILTKLQSEVVRKVISAVCIGICAFSVTISVFFAGVSSILYEWGWKGYTGELSEPKLLIGLNSLLTGRIRVLTQTDNWDGAIESWTWYGSANHDKFFDLGFVRLFYWYGIIPTAILLICFVLMLFHLYARRRVSELVFLAIISMFTIVEAHFVSVYIGRAYYLLIFGAVIPQMIEGVVARRKRKTVNYEL